MSVPDMPINTKQHVIATNPSFNLYDEMKQIVKPLVDETVFGGFMYTKIKNSGEHIVLSSDPFNQHFYLNEYKGPCFEGNALKTGIFIDTDIMDAGFCKNAYQALLAHKINSPATIIKQHAGYFEIFNFFLKKKQDNPHAIYVRNLALIETFSAYFLEEQQDIIQHAEATPIPMPDCYQNKFKYVPDTHQAKLINKILCYSQYLTKRERQCIPLLAKGYANKEIANSLFISVRTIEQYVNSMKQKLNCKSKIELTLKLQRLLRT